jgi:hypothetical protein
MQSTGFCRDELRMKLIKKLIKCGLSAGIPAFNPHLLTFHIKSFPLANPARPVGIQTEALINMDIQFNRTTALIFLKERMYFLIITSCEKKTRGTSTAGSQV